MIEDARCAVDALDAALPYTQLVQLGLDETVYDRLDGPQPSVEQYGSRRFLILPPELLPELAAEAFARIAHYLRTEHLWQLRQILDDPEASQNDQFVARSLLTNAVIAAEGTLPMCQDTGTAIVIAEKGQQVLTQGHDSAALSAGVARAYAERNLRYSIMAPLTSFSERNTGNNLPAQIDITAVPGETYRLLFVAKGGGSANRSQLFQATPALLDEARMLTFLEEKILALGTSACPPYHLAVVIGGLSAEHCLSVAKRVSCHDLDALPTTGSQEGRAFRDIHLEDQLLAMTRGSAIGAQFGGKYFCHDVRVVRLPRHATSLPIALSVSCSADRQAKALISSDGVFLERLETDPAGMMPELAASEDEDVVIDLRQPMGEIRASLSRLSVGTRVVLTGPLIVARDRVHAALMQRLASGAGIPAEFLQSPIYYSGPAKTPAGYACGSFGPTTSSRMDGYVNALQQAGASLVMLGKGHRTKEAVDACRANGGFYLGTIGGAAALAAEQHITRAEVIGFAEFGMEAAWRIEVDRFPAFLVIDDKGNDFFEQLSSLRPVTFQRPPGQGTGVALGSRRG